MGKEVAKGQNALATSPIGKTLMRFAIPAIISNLVVAVYNITDQIFIGHGVGYLGNAATNVAFPIVTIYGAIIALLGMGGAANFNLELGRGNKEKAKRIAGSALGMLVICGIVMSVLVRIFMNPLLTAFGATD